MVAIISSNFHLHQAGKKTESKQSEAAKKEGSGEHQREIFSSRPRSERYADCVLMTSLLNNNSRYLT